METLILLAALSGALSVLCLFVGTVRALRDRRPVPVTDWPKPSAAALYRQMVEPEMEELARRHQE